MQTVYRSLRAIPFRRGPRRWVAGICAGLAERFGWDANLVRLVMLIAFLLPVLGIGAYLLAWLLIPFSDNTIPLERLITRVKSR